MVSKWPTLILPEVVCSSHTCFSIYAHHNFPSISFTTILHNRKKVKDYHNGQTQAQKQRKLPTVSAKSVMKQEAGMSDVKILAGKWKIGVNTAGASKMSCKPISDSFGKRTYNLGGKLPRQSEQNTKFVHSTADLESKQAKAMLYCRQPHLPATLLARKNCRWVGLAARCAVGR